MTSNGDKASATFQEIGHPVVDADNVIIIATSRGHFLMQMQQVSSLFLAIL